MSTQERTAPRTPPAGTHPALAGYVALVIAAGGAIIVHSVYRLPSAPQPAGWLLLGVLAIVAASFALKVPGIPVYLSISDAFFMTSALLFGPAPATLSIALDSLVMSTRRRNNLQQRLFNLTSSAGALWAGIGICGLIAPRGPLVQSDAPLDGQVIAALTCFAAVYFALNSGLTAVAVGLSKRTSPWQMWRQHFAIISLNYFAAASASFFLVLLVRSVGLVSIAAVVPLILICHLAMRSWLGRVGDAERHVAKVNQLYLSTVSALATAIEAKDGVTSDHIHRVQTYAMGLAHALGITDALTLQAIEAAALLHDTGKIAIPEHILNKPGKLTTVEFETMKSHVDVGADILSSIDFPYPVVPIVRAHHENWDGSGYPHGLRGEAIPLGARILSVVDCFDALTSDRPYRPAMPESDALAVLLDRRGTMYDPAIVDLFVRVHRQIAPAAPATPVLQQALNRIRSAREPGLSAAPSAPPGAPPSATPDAMLAFVSLARLASQTPTLADIGALARGHIQQIAPGAALVLHAVDSQRNALVARYATDEALASMVGTAMGLGERVSGWCAANSRTMANADARLDLPQDLSVDSAYVSAFPLAVDGAIVGVLSLFSSAMLSEDQSRTLSMVAPHLATAVKIAAANAATGTGASWRDAETAPRRSRSDLRVVVSR